MELASSTLTAALVGVIVVLTKVIEWFIKRNANANANQGGHGDGNKPKPAKEYNGFGEVLARIDTKLDVLATGFAEMRQSRVQLLEHMLAAENAHERMIDRLGDVVASMEKVADGLDNLKDELKDR